MSGQVLTVLGWVLAPVCASLVTYIVGQRSAARAVAKAQGDAKSAHDAAMEEGMRALLRQQLIDYHRMYVASGEACPVRIKEQATAVHDAYAAIGGNGTGTQLWHEIMEAHVERPGR